MTKHEIANKWFHKLATRYIIRTYKKQIHERALISPFLYQPRCPSLEKEHATLWKSLNKRVTCSWFRYFSNISGIDDVNYVPEDIYYAIIEPILNDMNYSWTIADKNSYDSRYPGNYFPGTILRNTGGDFSDYAYKVISETSAISIMNEYRADLVIKPTIESGGGKNVGFLYFHDGHHVTKEGKRFGLQDVKQVWHSNFIIQERLRQDPFFHQFNPSSVNTLRIFTYRAPSSDIVTVLKTILRTGIGESEVDNESSGGISVGIKENGFLNDYACSKLGTKYSKHPTSHLAFNDKQVPKLDKFLAIARSLAESIASQRLLSFDMMLNSDGDVKVIEITLLLR